MALPDRVGVLGGGRMGAGIAHAFVVAGAGVTIVEQTTDAAHTARQRIAASLVRAEELGRTPTPANDLMTDVVTTANADELASCGLVIEAVPEALGLKLAVLRTVEQLAPDAALATNTSSIPISQIAAGLSDPTRLIGLHFFNPVPASALVEIVIGENTPPALTSAAETWVSELGKNSILVHDSPGFASSRLGVALALEAMRMVEEGVASAEDIDTAMTLGYRHPMGPLRTTDLVGLDVRLAIAEQLERELGPRFTPPQLLRDHVLAGRLGRKSSQGFYDWSD